MTVKRSKGGIREVDYRKVIWVQWVTRKHRKLTAFAVDPSSEERTGKLRALNGSLVPEAAVAAEAATTKDPFCLELVEKLRANDFSLNNKNDKKSKERLARVPVVQVPPVSGPDPLGDNGFFRCDGLPIGHPSDFAHYVVRIDGQTVGKVDIDKIDETESVQLRVSAKSWGVYQNKTRKAFSRR